MKTDDRGIVSRMNASSLGVRQRRIVGVAILLAGLAVLPGLYGFSQARVALTNYNSTLDVETPTVYYAHELRAGDTVHFSLTVTGGPVDVSVLDPGGFRGFEQGGDIPIEVRPELFLPGVLGSVEFPLVVPATGRHIVLFEPACPGECAEIGIRARLSLSMGSVGGVPITTAYVLAAAAALTGGLLAASPGVQSLRQVFHRGLDGPGNARRVRRDRVRGDEGRGEGAGVLREDARPPARRE